jgi:hypothetical protein
MSHTESTLFEIWKELTKRESDDRQRTAAQSLREHAMLCHEQKISIMAGGKVGGAAQALSPLIKKTVRGISAPSVAKTSPCPSSSSSSRSRGSEFEDEYLSILRQNGVIEQQEPKNEDETAILHLKRKREEIELESFKKKLAEEDEDRQEERELKRLQREVEKKKLIKELASL